MEPRSIVTIVAMIGFAVTLYLAFYVASLKTGKKKYHRMGLKALMPCIVVVVLYSIMAAVNDAELPDFRTRVPGPASGTGSTLREVRFPVTDWRNGQEVELTMTAAEVAKGNLRVQYRVQDPDGKDLASAEQLVGPATGADWQPIRFQFSSEVRGDHKILVEIPQGVDMMGVVVTEVR